ncbi:hypothetical protein CLE01_30730 [Cryobacterium levicorallinum]|nr:hypothetical protein CLE01_30730 [Cryobacterium levicorallinum]
MLGAVEAPASPRGVRSRAEFVTDAPELVSGGEHVRLKVTLARSNGQNDDIVVTAAAAAGTSDVAGTIARVDPRSAFTPGGADRPLTLRTVAPGGTDWLLLPPDALIGEDWVGSSGARVALADSDTFFLSHEHGAAATLAVIRVLTGPDAGAHIALGRGTTIIGRDAECDVVLSDKLVSKRHVRLEVAAGIDLVDLGSANGVVIDGGLVTRLHIEQSETAQIGDTQLRIAVVQTVAAIGDQHRDGPVCFNRSTRVEGRYAGQDFAAPEVCRPRKTTSRSPGWPWWHRFCSESRPRPTMRSRNTIDASLRGALLPEFQESLEAVITEHATVD